MITKHRNRGLAQLVFAILMTVGLVFGVLKDGRHTSDGMTALLVLLYFATVTMWMVGSFSLAKAKGYGSDMMGGVFLFLFILGFCFPIAPFAMPAVVIFGLKDKTRERWRRF
jgi:hypothetical protein